MNMRDFQEGPEKVEWIEHQHCTHCRCTLPQNVYWNTGKFAEHFVLTGKEKNSFSESTCSKLGENKALKIESEAKMTQRWEEKVDSSNL